MSYVYTALAGFLVGAFLVYRYRQEITITRMRIRKSIRDWLERSAKKIFMEK